MNKKIVSLSLNIFFLTLAIISALVFIIDIFAALALFNSLPKPALVIFWLVGFIAFIPTAFSLTFSSFFLGGKLRIPTFLVSMLGIICFIIMIVLMANLT